MNFFSTFTKVVHLAEMSSLFFNMVYQSFLVFFKKGTSNKIDSEKSKWEKE